MLYYYLSGTIDGPCVVQVNMFLRSISKIDDYKMVSSLQNNASKNQEDILIKSH